MDPIRVLYINGGIMDRGGISSYMMNYYRHIDRTKVQLDFIVHGFEKGVYDDEIKALGGKIYNLPIKSKDYLGNIRGIRKIFKSGNYKIVHSHMDAMGALVLKEAKKCGIPIRIAHSHNTAHITKSKLKFLLNEFARSKISKYSTHLFACSELAGEWLFKKNKDLKDVKIIKNAIELQKYKYNSKIQIELKEELKLEDSFVIGHIGRFDDQKNHKFLLKVFINLIKSIPSAKLILIGDGHLRPEIEAQIIKYKLTNNVLLLGQRSDINILLNTFDVFLLPSLFEGLPVVAIEAQANGLNCILSSTITKEVDLTGNIRFLNINSTNEWIKTLLNIKENKRVNYTKQITEKGYEIKSAAKELSNIYLKMFEGVEK